MINESDFRRIDLNLLVVFAALMRERSVSRAASRLFLGQPAVSAALKRLRELCDDQLFVRTGKEMSPTPRAVQLAARIGPSLQAIRDAIAEPSGFDPATAKQVFRIGTSDAIEVALLPSLMARLREQAPGCSVIVRSPNARFNARTALDADEVDVVIGPADTIPSWQRSEVIATVQFVCLFDAARLGITAPITLAQFLGFPHLLTTFAGDLHGFVDELLAARGLKRQVILGTPHFGVLPMVLRQTDSIVTLPQLSAQMFSAQFGLAVSPLPLPVEPMSLVLQWSATTEQDPALAWLRAQVLACGRAAIRPADDRTA
ncbi:MAG: LysR family transcriptional regulator [Burkholderiaceae bacterium]